MEKLTPKQRKTINRITDAFNSSDISMTLNDLMNVTGYSKTILFNSFEKMGDVKQDESGYYLDKSSVSKPATEIDTTQNEAVTASDDLDNPSASTRAVNGPLQVKWESPAFLDILKKSARIIATQDNVGTANPAYCVKERTRRCGIDENYSDAYVWNDVSGEVDFDNEDAVYEALNILADYTGEEEITVNGDTYRKIFYRDEERTVTTCFTYAHAQDYIDANHHNLKDPFIYVESFNRNPEMLAVRELLLFLANNPTAFDGVFNA